MDASAETVVAYCERLPADERVVYLREDGAKVQWLLYIVPRRDGALLIASVWFTAPSHKQVKRSKPTF